MPLQTAQISAPPKPVCLTKQTIVAKLTRYFGSEDRLENWHQLYRDMGIDDTLGCITKCRSALRKVWVNIYDLIEAVRKYKIPRRFRTQSALSNYTISTDRIYPKKKAKEGGPVGRCWHISSRRGGA
ncbi:hypothetical protein BKA65DRAFT_447974 [Rhexocercosporidium sp. MPI-PUGE-AT-0058]|nr:hypothetical protein BKA65DRAFT_447974 [Rhexocercosporidium sp. MPI-PUGE-AT-0058]